MQLSDFEREISRELQEFFSDRISDFTINEFSDAPILEFSADFGVYSFCVISVQISHDRVCFSWREQGYLFELTTCQLLSSVSDSGGDKIGKLALDKLNKEIMLRIPDKYLVAKGFTQYM